MSTIFLEDDEFLERKYLNVRKPVIWTNDIPVYWHTYASFGLKTCRYSWSKKLLLVSRSERLIAEALSTNPTERYQCRLWSSILNREYLHVNARPCQSTWPGHAQFVYLQPVIITFNITAATAVKRLITHTTVKSYKNAHLHIEGLSNRNDRVLVANLPCCYSINLSI